MNVPNIQITQEAILSEVEQAARKAAQFLNQAMDDDSIPVGKKVILSREMIDFYIKLFRVEVIHKKATRAQDEEAPVTVEEDSTPPPVFRLY